MSEGFWGSKAPGARSKLPPGRSTAAASYHQAGHQQHPATTKLVNSSSQLPGRSSSAASYLDGQQQRPATTKLVNSSSHTSSRLLPPGWLIEDASYHQAGRQQQPATIRPRPVNSSSQRPPGRSTAASYMYQKSISDAEKALGELWVEPKDDPDPSTSTTPRKWLPVSKRWRPQLEKLAKIDDSKVVKVKSLVFVKDEEFRIAQGSMGTEVFLGLTVDGTEVAVKRMPKSYCQALKHEKDFLRLPELDDPLIVQYVDFAEDEDFGYLALQLCEYTLEEYIKTLPEQRRKQLAEQFLKSLRILHCQTLLHRDIKPQNVLIDIHGKARLADFGISRKLPEGQSTLYTPVAGTKYWKAKETLDEDSKIPYKRSTDIQVAGMLIYYILSGGHHPFGRGARCEANILDGKYDLRDVQDVVAKDLIEQTINEDPKKRPKVEECLAHPFFWSNARRVRYLRWVGKHEEVVKLGEDADMDLLAALDHYAELGGFNAWKQKFPQEWEVLDEYPEDSFGLLCFIYILYLEHNAVAAAGINLMEMFPDLFGYVYKFAKEQGWNSRHRASSSSWRYSFLTKK